MTSLTNEHISGALGDYLEAIYVLSGEKSYVRITDISTYMDISKPSVNRAVNMLKNKGYAEHKPYGDITLTDKGRRVGAEVRKRRNAVKNFLISALNLPEETAETEAKRIERVITRNTIDAMTAYNKA